jgi:hypothetical protein
MLAQPSVQRTLHDIWQNTATAWLVSDYLLMPDHLHLFCAPHDLKFTIERWIGFWKDQLAKQLKREGDAAARPTKRIGNFKRAGFTIVCAMAKAIRRRGNMFARIQCGRDW